MFSILQKFIKNKRVCPIAEIARCVPGVQFTTEARWSDFTSLGAGTGTFPLLRVRTVEQVAQLVTLLCKYRPDLRIYPIGGGTNIIGADRDVPNTVFLKLMPLEDFQQIDRTKHGLFSVGGAVSLKNLLDYACACSYGGASAIYGIPGTVGGATRMNAGANGKCISDFIEYIEVVDLTSGSVKRVRQKSIEWEYRRTSMPDTWMVLRVWIRLQPVDPKEENQLLRREILRRMRAPAGRSAGSTFKNPSPNFPAGKILEKCGAKEFCDGRFAVSADHANWVINRTDRKEMPSSCEAYRQTLDRMADCVFQKTGIILHPEVRFIDMEAMASFGENRKPIKVLVLKGGVSSEREISLQSAANVAKSLREAGFDVREYDIKKLEITDDMKWADVVYPVLHGGFGEDGTLQKLLEDNGIRAVGSSAAAMKTVMDKIAAKKVMDANGVTNARYAVVTDAAAPIPEGLELPLIVKPNSEGSTFGLTLVEDPSQWKGALATALKYDKNALVEEYIAGVEATVGILLGKALPLVEIRYPGKLYDYDAKYTHAQGETKYICPPTGISAKAQQEAREMCMKFAKAVGAESLVRVDVIIRSKDDRVYVLEGNSMPGCTASSLLPKAAMASGISLVELYTGLVFDALKKNPKKI